MANLTDTSCLIMQKYLVAQELFTLPSDSDDWPLYVTSLPDNDNNAGLVVDNQDVIDGRLMSTGENIKHYAISVIVRASDYETGWLKAKSILTDFCAVQNITVVVGSNSYQLGAVTKNSGILSLGMEPGTKRRYMFRLNCNITLEEL